jgi:serine/threonine-protein kinase RsbW
MSEGEKRNFGCSFSRSWELPSKYGSERWLTRRVARIVRAGDPNEERVDDMVTAIAEACLNAIEHGNRFDERRRIRLQMTVDGEKYRYRVWDGGVRLPNVPVERSVAEKWRADQPRGWGLQFIREFADRFEFGMDNGAVYAEMTFYRTGRGTH